jgi:hypothetical protein
MTLWIGGIFASIVLKHMKCIFGPSSAYKKLVSVCIACTLCVRGYCQDQNFPLNISFFNESTAIPFTRLVTMPIHPGIQVGTEFNYNQGEHTRTFQSLNLSYFYHNHLTQGIGLHTEIGYEYRFGFGLALEGLFGLGYLHTFATADEYTFANGAYEKKPDKGNARLFPSLSLDMGYYLNDSPQASKIFIRYQSWFEYPYSPGFIPVMPHISLHLGLRFYI